MIFYCLDKLFQFFIGFSLSLLLNDFFDRKYPNEYRIFVENATNFLISSSYNCIYYYSKLQIFYTKYIETNPFYLKVLEAIKAKTGKTTNLDILFVKNNFHYKVSVDLPDLIITTDLSRNPNPKRITYSENCKDELTFQETEVKFMLIEFSVGEHTYKIDLKSNTYNYYIVGNKFTKDFFIFYINEYVLSKYEQHQTNKDEKYTLKIIDHTVNIITLDFTDKNDGFVLDKNSYKVTCDCANRE